MRLLWNRIADGSVQGAMTISALPTTAAVPTAGPPTAAPATTVPRTAGPPDPAPVLGWPPDAPALLAALGEDNTPEHFARIRDRHAAAVLAPTRALARALEPEFGPVRVFRPRVDRRFRPGAPPYRTDTGGVAVTAGGTERAVVLSAESLTVTAGVWRFDPGRLRRYRAAVDDGLAALLTGMAGWTLDRAGALVRVPRGYPPDHPLGDLLRLRGLLISHSRPVGDWLATPEVLHHVRTAWRAAGPLADWLDTHVGPPAPVPPRPVPSEPREAPDGP